MNKKLLVLLFFSCAIAAFQDDFETIEKGSKTTSSIDVVIASKPYGYCVLDELPIKHCKTVSIDLLGSTYQKYALVEVPEIINSGDELDSIAQSYYLGVDNFEYHVPSPGQLAYLINQNVVPKDPACYWIKTSEVGPYRTAAYNLPFCNSGAKLSRLVTKDVPSACSNPYEDCGFGIKNKVVNFLVKNWSRPIRMVITYTDTLTDADEAIFYYEFEASDVLPLKVIIPHFVNTLRIGAQTWHEAYIGLPDGLGGISDGWNTFVWNTFKLGDEICLNFTATGSENSYLTNSVYEDCYE